MYLWAECLCVCVLWAKRNKRTLNEAGWRAENLNNGNVNWKNAIRGTRK